MTTFTRGGHGFGEEEGLTQFGAPQHGSSEDGAYLHSGGAAQQPEMSAAAGMHMNISCWTVLHVTESM